MHDQAGAHVARVTRADKPGPVGLVTRAASRGSRGAHKEPVIAVSRPMVVGMVPLC